MSQREVLTIAQPSSMRSQTRDAANRPVGRLQRDIEVIGAFGVEATLVPVGAAHSPSIRAGFRMGPERSVGAARREMSWLGQAYTRTTPTFAVDASGPRCHSVGTVYLID